MKAFVIELYENKSRTKGSSAVTNNAPDIAVGQFYLDTECIYIVARNGSSKYMLVVNLETGNCWVPATPNIDEVFGNKTLFINRFRFIKEIKIDIIQFV